MKRLIAICVLIALCVTATPSWGTVAVYTTEASFTAQLQAGYYQEGFNYAPWTTAVNDDGYGPIGAPQLFGSWGDWSYELSSPSELDGQLMPDGGGAVVGQGQGQSVTINFDTYLMGPLPTAVGGIFWATDLNGTFMNGDTVTITLTLANLETYTYSDTSDWDAFTGFISTSPITNISIQTANWTAMDNLTVGVPEPATLVLLGLGGLLLRKRR